MAATHASGRVDVTLAIHPVHALVPVHADRGGPMVQDEMGQRLCVLREGVGVDVFPLLKYLRPGPDRGARVVLTRPLVYLLGTVVDVETHLVVVLVLYGFGVQKPRPAEANTRALGPLVQLYGVGPERLAGGSLCGEVVLSPVVALILCGVPAETPLCRGLITERKGAEFFEKLLLQTHAPPLLTQCAHRKVWL